MNDAIAEFAEFLRSHGLIPPSELIADGKFHRCATVEKPRQNDASYLLHLDGVPAGGFQNFRDGTGKFHTWSQRSTVKLTDSEREYNAARMKEMRAASERNRIAQYEIAATHAREFWESSADCITHPYLTRKKVLSHGLRVNGDLLVIPVYDGEQIITCQTIAPDGTKLFTAGGRKKGGSYTIHGDDTTLVCEGYATGASLYEATGHTVVIAFDAGNLAPVCKNLKGKFIICADNDAGKESNTGLIAANKIGCRVVYPEAINGQPTDFNDVSHDDIRAALSPQDEQQPAQKIADKAPFRFLGYDDGQFYYFTNAGNQIVSLSAAQHTKLNFLRLAPKEHWEIYYSGKSGIDGDAIANELISKNYNHGVFSPERIRGRGAWSDDKRQVVHTGTELSVDGVTTPLNKFKSKYIYCATHEMSIKLTQALPNKQANKLVDILTQLSWENQLSAYLLAGWCVIAPICGVLKWRPHLWLTGAASSGKSTVLNDIIRPLVGNFAISVEGSTTEAAIRQEMGHDARPVIFDEADSESHTGRVRIKSIIELARTSSSGGTVSKGGQDGKSKRYAVRGCFLFSSINTMISEYSDETRFSKLILRKNTAANAEEFYRTLETEIASTFTPEYADGLFSRSVENLNIIQENIRVFSAASGHVFRNRRISDQIGAMLGGLYLCYSTKPATVDAAKAWIEKHGWNEHTATEATQDEMKLLERILTSRLHIDTDKGRKEITIGDAIKKVAGLEEPQERDYIISTEQAKKALGLCGIKVADDRQSFIIANDCTPMRKLLADTSWQNNWANPLRQIKGAQKTEAQYFSSGITQRGTELPMVLV